MKDRWTDEERKMMDKEMLRDLDEVMRQADEVEDEP